MRLVGYKLDHMLDHVLDHMLDHVLDHIRRIFYPDLHMLGYSDP